MPPPPPVPPASPCPSSRSREQRRGKRAALARLMASRESPLSRLRCRCSRQGWCWAQGKGSPIISPRPLKSSVTKRSTRCTPRPTSSCNTSHHAALLSLPLRTQKPSNCPWPARPASRATNGDLLDLAAVTPQLGPAGAGADGGPVGRQGLGLVDLQLLPDKGLSVLRGLSGEGHPPGRRSSC